MRAATEKVADDDDPLQEDLKQWGAPDDVVVSLCSSVVQHDYVVWPENQEALTMFLRLQTAWHRDPSGYWCGLDYPSVQVVMTAMDRWPDQSLFADIQAMEWAVLDEIRSGR
ncbi:MAG: DUF1799 domain-containing protein [Magnetococcales bacterium]|nr:DUF1799 domain-containing protein [Magnetococcales bacterium]